MASFCPKCGTVQPQETGGSAVLRCPRCARQLLAEQPAWGDFYSAPHAAGALAANPSAATAAAHVEAAVPSRVLPSPELLVHQYDGWIVAHRWLATVVDHITLFVGMLLLLCVGQLVLGDDLFQKTVIGWLLPALAYFPVLEGRYGATPGKLLVGLRVVDAAGNPPGLAKASIRTVFRLIEVNPLIGSAVVAGICVLCTRKRQRLGDMAAGTFVLTADDARIAQGRKW